MNKFLAYAINPPTKQPRRGTDPELILCTSNGTLYIWNRETEAWSTQQVSITDPESEANTALPFSTDVPFTKAYSFMQAHGVTADLEFTPDFSGAQPGAVTMVRLLADGTHAVTFSGITEINTSAGYDNRENILNHLVFFYDGVRVMVNIFQDVNAQAADIIAPILQTAAIANATRDRIVLTYDEALNEGSEPDPGDFSISGKTITAVTVSGSTVLVDVDADFAYQEVVTISYTPGSNPIMDTDGNQADGFTGQAVTNNISAPDLTAPVFQSAQVANANKNKIVLTYNEDLSSSVIPATTDFSPSGGKTVTNVAISGPTVTLTVNSNYANGDTITVSYTPGTNKLQDLNGNFAASLSSQSVTNNIQADFQTVVWENLVNTTESGGFLNYQAPTAGARGTVALTVSAGFEVKAQLTSLCPATVVMIDKDASNAYAWGGSQAFEAGFYYFGPGFYVTQNGTVFIEKENPFTVPKWAKMRRSGNDVIISTSPDDITYTDVHTFTGALSGITTVYIHVLFAENNPGDKIQVKYKVG